MRKLVLIAFALCLFAEEAQALGRRRVPPAQYQAPRAVVPVGEAVDALAEVNAARAARGLRPYLRDDGLTVAAKAAAKYRAERGIRGHCNSDFVFLPAGAHSNCAGCAALDASWKFQACEQFGRWTYCGAASVQGADGRMYHHAFYK